MGDLVMATARDNLSKNIKKYRKQMHMSQKALALGRVTIFLITFRMKIDLVHFRLDFLHTKDVRIDLCEKIRKTFFDAGANSCDIPRDKSHVKILSLINLEN